MCVYTDTPEDCAAHSTFTAGAPGTLCDGSSAACVTMSPAPGGCCDNLPNPLAGGANCFVGPRSPVFVLSCTSQGGALHLSSLCNPATLLSESCM
jgi:hypothetical protein